jgi:hypothetical protein
MKNMYIMMAVYLTMACGSGDEISAPTQCSVDLAFVGVGRGEVADTVYFEAAPTNECIVLFKQRNGGVIWTVEERGEKIIGKIKEISFGEGRVAVLDPAGTEGDISGGSAYIRRTYMTGDMSNAAAKGWMLPWVDPPKAIKVDISVASGTKPESYPKQVKVTVESEEKAQIEAAKKAAAEKPK